MFDRSLHKPDCIFPPTDPKPVTLAILTGLSFVIKRRQFLGFLYITAVVQASI